MGNKYIILGLSSLLVGVIFFSWPKSGREVASLESKRELETVLLDLGNAVERGTNSAAECNTILRRFYNTLLSMTAKDFDLKSNEGKLRDLIESSFETRLKIREKMKVLPVSNGVERECLISIIDVNRALRYIEDYLGEIVVRKGGRLGEDFKSLDGEAPYLLINPLFKDKFSNYKDLKSGDVLLSRGNAYSSAAIARIGTTDAQFSHLSLVYKHEETGVLYTVEAHIEVGNVVEELQVHLDSKNSREVVYRFNDPVIAHKAAKIMYDKVKARQDKGKNICYDFGMDYKSSKCLFCSEVIYDGYFQASKGELDIPKFKTKFDRGLLPFLKKLGIKVNEKNVDTFLTFSPGDIEFDPRFELVAEFKNPNKLFDTRAKDMVLTKIFEWMQEDQYRFKPRTGAKLGSYFGWSMRRIPFINSKILKLKNKFPLNMGAGALQIFIVLDTVGKDLMQQIEEAQKKVDYPLAPREMYKILENYREDDLLTYIVKRGSAGFHRQFRPSKKAIKAFAKANQARVKARKELLYPNGGEDEEDVWFYTP